MKQEVKTKKGDTDSAAKDMLLSDEEEGLLFDDLDREFGSFNVKTGMKDGKEAR